MYYLQSKRLDWRGWMVGKREFGHSFVLCAFINSGALPWGPAERVKQTPAPSAVFRGLECHSKGSCALTKQPHCPGIPSPPSFFPKGRLGAATHGKQNGHWFHCARWQGRLKDLEMQLMKMSARLFFNVVHCFYDGQFNSSQRTRKVLSLFFDCCEHA